MESLREPINSLFFEEEMNSELIEPGTSGALISHHQIPFLQMLQGAMQLAKPEPETEGREDHQDEEERHLHFQLHHRTKFFRPESHLQLLLRVQAFQTPTWAAELTGPSPHPTAEPALDSCITHAAASESPSVPAPPARKKRRRSRAPLSLKNPEEAESQRMTHIAVERNRRRLMNDHLSNLRNLMPPSFVQRGDQASIVGGAIDFVKELEQLLLSLQAEKSLRAGPASACSSPSTTTAQSGSNGGEACHVAAAGPLDGFFVSPQYTSYSRRRGGEEGEGAGVDVEATAVQGHVTVKVLGRRRAGLLCRAVAALEDLRLAVLHLTVTSLDTCSVFYSLNLKMEEDCKLDSADEIAAVVHQIFSYIGANC